MTVKMTRVLSSLRSAWDEVNPLSEGGGFSLYEFLEGRVHSLEQEIAGVRRQLSEAQSASAYAVPREFAQCCTLEQAGKEVTEISGEHSFSERRRATVDAMRLGAEVIYQGALSSSPWQGYADFPVRVPGPG